MLGAISTPIASHTARARSGASAPANTHDLLVGRMIRQLRGRRHGQWRIGRLQQRLVSDPDLLGSGVEPVQ
ncbi:hypothetical protein [Streptomyces sp. LN704]|uniref:hypothetical protein n=1 Tax=Streptomyces sp. LN704 TaxID=3112982 RepID=UPI00371F1A20